MKRQIAIRVVILVALLLRSYALIAQVKSLAMLQKARETTGRPLYMVLGGFHLLSTPASDVSAIVAGFKTPGVRYAGPTHCTGDYAMELFKQAYGGNYISGGVGTTVRVDGG